MSAEGKLSQLSRGTGAAKMPAKVAGLVEGRCTCPDSLVEVMISRVLTGKVMEEEPAEGTLSRRKGAADVPAKIAGLAWVVGEVVPTLLKEGDCTASKTNR